jgi:FtsP/CotA-like multicopper oxidase with cupredoxin domain
MNVEKTSRSSVDDEDDEDDVEGQYNPEWKAEQAARLLPFDDIEDSLADKIYVPTDYGSPTARHGVLKTAVRNSAAVAIGIVLCVIFLIASGRISGFQITQEQTTTQQTGFRRLPSDYILSPDWDISENPTTRRYQWTISDEEVNPDGVYRQMILINGQFPGPLIECNEGDTLEIEIDNQSINATSFHWHGIYQNGSNWMDGTVGVTQCPIAPGGKFTYKFTIQGQSGTYWYAPPSLTCASELIKVRYHSHHVLQAADGLVGPFIIHSAKEKEYQQLEYSTDQVILIQDYYHDPSYSLLPAYLSNGRENSEPIPAGSLINGQNM